MILSNRTSWAHTKPGFQLSLLLFLAAGCGGSGEVAADPLPFHLGVLPLEIEASEVEDELAEQEDALQLDLDAARLEAALQRELEGTAFTRVTVLQAPAHPEGTNGGTNGSHAPDEASLQELAYEQGVDMILRAKLVYDPVVDGHINDKFWLNFPLFALGGPFCYFIDDRSYDCRARLVAEFHDTSRPRDELNDRSVILGLPIMAECEGVDLDFIDRAEASASSYALSFLIPAGLLAKENEAVDREVEDGVLQTLCWDLAGKVQNARPEFHQSDLARFHMDERVADVRRNGKGRVDADCPFVDTSDRGLRRFGLSAGGALLEQGSPALEDDGRFWIRLRGLDVPADVHHVQLFVEGAGGSARRYTLSIRDPE